MDRRSRPSQPIFGLVAGVGLALAVVLVLVARPAVLGPASSAAAPSPSPRSAFSVSETASPSPVASPSVPGMGLVRYDNAGITFDYPASWHPSGQPLNEHYITIRGYVGTASGDDSCVTITPGPGDTFISETACSPGGSVGAGQVLVKIETTDGPPGRLPLIDPSDPSRLQAGQRYVTVGGVPAILTEQGTASDSRLTWEIPSPKSMLSEYIIQAEFNDPDAAGLRAQVEALIASVGFDPPLPVLDPADGPKIAAVVVRQEQAQKRILDCFPIVPGTSARATITQLPMTEGALAKPLPVTCSTRIDPTTYGFWKLTLTVSWTAASDRTAGTATTTVYARPDGTPEAEDNSGDIPYQR